jgi:cyclase
MLNPRLVPSLLVDHQLHLVKTTCFCDRHYLGDPLNAAYVFSGYEVDELLVLDIDATPDGRTIPLPFVAALSRFTTVPLTVGGGIHSLEQIEAMVALGVEKVALSAVLDHHFDFLSQAAARFGSSTISVVLNVTAEPGCEATAQFGREGKAQPMLPLALACQHAGAGEFVIHLRHREGTRSGYDIPLLAELNNQLSIPLMALGGCGHLQHIHDLLKSCSVSAVGAGSLFAYAPGSHEVLLNYPETNAWLSDVLYERPETSP